MSLKTLLDSRPAIAIAAEESEERRARETAMVVRVFDPRTDVSADARYVVRNLVLWFLVLPIALGIIIWAVTR
jgi:hypothetical protein